MKADKVYIELLKERLEYFQDKKITELKTDEIYEYINLQEEVTEIFGGLASEIVGIWKNIYGEAFERYSERVLKK